MKEQKTRNPAKKYFLDILIVGVVLGSRLSRKSQRPLKASKLQKTTKNGPKKEESLKSDSIEKSNLQDTIRSLFSIFDQNDVRPAKGFSFRPTILDKNLNRENLFRLFGEFQECASVWRSRSKKIENKFFKTALKRKKKIFSVVAPPDRIYYVDHIRRELMDLRGNIANIKLREPTSKIEWKNYHDKILRENELHEDLVDRLWGIVDRHDKYRQDTWRYRTSIFALIIALTLFLVNSSREFIANIGKFIEWSPGAIQEATEWVSYFLFG